MNTWNQAPFVRLLLPFVAGILVAVYIPSLSNWILVASLCLTSLVMLIVAFKKLNFSYKNSWWFGLIINLTLFISAYQFTIYKTENFSSLHFSNYSNSLQYAYIKITDPYLEKDKTLKVVAQVLAIKQGNQWKKTSGKGMFYFKKDSRSLKLEYGDEIMTQVYFKDVPPPQNPGEFNYKRFLSFHNIYQQAYVNQQNWCFTGNYSCNVVINYAVTLRNKLLKIFTENNLAGDELSVGAALMLGLTDKLDSDIISAYSSTGALHVLSVSGLHVAIVFVVFNWLLFFFDKIKNGNIFKAIILILLLWFYAALTGLSPSVLRAATMFSFIIVAKAFNRYTNIYNTLAVSAFALLLFNPYLIMEVGFQLSYLAVIGIVYLQPKIYNWFEAKNWLLDQIWTITSVSIAAQIATFPLGLHYFHQFPNYFLLSNLVVIPISTAIVYLGIVLFVFAKASLIAGYIAKAFSFCVWFLNQSVLIIEKWPYSLLQGISISVFETWLLYALIILLMYYFTKRQFYFLILTLCFAIAILISQIIEQSNQFKQKKIIVYNIPKTCAIDFINAKNNFLFTDTAFAKNESRLLFHVKHNWWDLGINKNQIVTEDYTSNYLHIHKQHIQFFDKKIILLNEFTKARNTDSAIVTDYLIISQNPKIKMEDILKQYKAQLIIFDSSNYNFKVKKWKEQCYVLNQNFYSVSEKGALTINL